MSDNLTKFPAIENGFVSFSASVSNEFEYDNRIDQEEDT